MLVRKISQAKWRGCAAEADKPLPADAVTADLRTQGNCLSVWRMASVEEITEIALAVVSSQERLDDIDLVAMDEDEVAACGLSVEGTAGLTPVRDLQERHSDIVSLTYDDLGGLGRAVVNGIRNERIWRIRSKQIVDLLVDAVRKGRLELRDLKKEVLEKVAEAVPPS
jgi:hypothetical protein